MHDFNLILNASVSPSPATMAVNFSMNTLTCLFRRHAWEYFIVFLLGQVTSSVAFGLGIQLFGLVDGYALVLNFFFGLSKSALGLLQVQHHHLPHHGLSPSDSDWGQSVF